MTYSRGERRAISETARKRRSTRKRIIHARISRLFARLRKRRTRAN